MWHDISNLKVPPKNQFTAFGSLPVLDFLRGIFRGHAVPEDPKAVDVIWWVNEFLKDPKNTNNPFRVNDVLFIGPKESVKGRSRIDRLIVTYGVGRIITDISVG